MYKFAKKVANHEGFTLVELIVVIAILGILAGIAIPVYSGYINKANQAADVMLLGAVNTALAAACAENDFARLSDCAIDIKNEKIAGIIPEVETMDDDPAAAVGTMDLADKIAASFLVYFGNNTETPLKYATDASYFEFDDTKQTFSIKGVGSGSSLDNSVPTLASIVDSLKASLSSNLTGSSFEGNEEALLDEVQNLTNTAANLAGNGVLETVLNGAFSNYLSDHEVDTTDPNAVANSVTLFLADQISDTSTVDSEKIKEIWASNQFSPIKLPDVQSVMALYKNGTGLTTLGAIGLFYANTEGMMQYVKSNYSGDYSALEAEFNKIPNQLATAEDANDIWNVLFNAKNNMFSAASSDPALVSCIANYGANQGATDATAFINAMNTIHDNSSNLQNYIGESDLFNQIKALLNNGD